MGNSPLSRSKSSHIAPVDSLSGENARFFMARLDGRAVGCGALVLAEGYGEIKRMFGDPATRGQGLGRALLGAIESAGRADALNLLRLGTGIRQHEPVAPDMRDRYQTRAPVGN